MVNRGEEGNRQGEAVPEVFNLAVVVVSTRNCAEEEKRKSSLISDLEL